VELRDIVIGGLYSCYHPLEMWIRHGDGSLHELIDDLAPNKPFVVLEANDSLTEYCDIYQLKILTCDGIICWVDVGKTNSSIQEITDGLP